VFSSEQRISIDSSTFDVLVSLPLPADGRGRIVVTVQQPGIRAREGLPAVSMRNQDDQL
jgi:hypothetical protein